MDDKLLGLGGCNVQVHFSIDSDTPADYTFLKANTFGIFAFSKFSAGTETQFIPWIAIHHLSFATSEIQSKAEQRGKERDEAHAKELANLEAHTNQRAGFE